MHANIRLQSIEEGMKVFDRAHHEIGKVDWVQFGEDDPATPDVEAEGLSDLDERTSLVDNIADVFRPDDLPEEIRERLMQQGFVRIDAEGLFAADRYVTPEQIDSISADGLLLNVTRDELVKRH